MHLLCLLVMIVLDPAYGQKTAASIDNSTRQFDALMEVAAESARTAPTVNLDPFRIEVPSTGFFVHKFIAEFFGGALTGFERMERHDECRSFENNATMTCALRLNEISITAKAKVRGDVFVPMEHPIQTISWFTDGHLIARLNKTATDSLPELEDVQYSRHARMKSTITGTLSLNKQRDFMFRNSLNSKLQAMVRDSFLKYLSVQNSKAPR